MFTTEPTEGGNTGGVVITDEMEGTLRKFVDGYFEYNCIDVRNMAEQKLYLLDVIQKSKQKSRYHKRKMEKADNDLNLAEEVLEYIEKIEMKGSHDAKTKNNIPKTSG